MNKARVTELLESIIYLANDAKKMESDADILDCLDLIEGDVLRIRDEGALNLEVV